LGFLARRFSSEESQLSEQTFCVEWLACMASLFPLVHMSLPTLPQQQFVGRAQSVDGMCSKLIRSENDGGVLIPQIWKISTVRQLSSLFNSLKATSLSSLEHPTFD
jgi:hypothetical protein